LHGVEGEDVKPCYGQQVSQVGARCGGPGFARADKKRRGVDIGRRNGLG
jgi:hypothetical protein